MVCGYILFTHCSFGIRRSKRNFDRETEYMKKFYADLASMQ